MPKVAVVGVGNCCCSLVQALQGLRSGRLAHVDLIGGLESVDPREIEIVAAFDVDAGKVGRPLEEAIFAEPNCTTRYLDVPPSGPIVGAGPVEDGIAGPLEDVVKVADEVTGVTAHNVADVLREAYADTVVIYLPVGAQRAADVYAVAAADAGCALVNCTPAILGRAGSWRDHFAHRGLPLIGDDMKSHLGSTTIHQGLLQLLRERGIAVTSTYQLNVGGNTDFLNMRDTDRSAAKRQTKIAALNELLPSASAMTLGPSDHISQLRDRKIGYIRIEGEGYLGMQLSLELRLDVEDSPNTAAVAIEAIRLASAMRSGLDLDLPDALPRLFKAPRPTGE